MLEELGGKYRRAEVLDKYKVEESQREALQRREAAPLEWRPSAQKQEKRIIRKW